MIRAEDFSFSYPLPAGMAGEGRTLYDRRALNGLRFTVDRGEFVLLTGDSGSGKSTLLLALSGMAPHVTGGKIGGKLLVDGRDIRDLNPSLLAETTGVAFQNPHTQLFTPTVREEVAFSLQNRGVPGDEMARRIGEALDFTGLGGFEDRSPRELSGGEKQRLLLAVLLAWDPPVYLLDEPLSALDPGGAEQILSLLRTLNRKKGKTIVLAEKNLASRAGEFDRHLFLEEGRLSPGPARPPLEYPPVPGKNYRGGPPLVLSDLDFSYDDRFPLFRNFTLTINPGETVGLTGVNGTGKTTLASLLMGILRLRSGRLTLGDRDLRPLNIARRADYLSYLFQNPDHQLFAPTLGEEIGFGLEREDRDRRAGDILESFGLSPLVGYPPAMLSFAMRKRVALAVTAARDTPFVILDEPDWGQDREGLETIRRYVSDGIRRGVGFLLISHNEDLVRELADREIVLERSRPRD